MILDDNNILKNPLETVIIGNDVNVDEDDDDDDGDDGDGDGATDVSSRRLRNKDGLRRVSQHLGVPFWSGALWCWS